VKTPLVSVVIPTYNNAALLPETLDGVQRQTIKDFEIIVVDDGSLDDTAQVVKSYDPSIVYFHQTNRGQAAARNKGVALARGEYIAFCDHDDVWHEPHLETLMDCLTSYPETAMAFDNAEYFGDGVARRLCVDPRLSKSLNREKISARFLIWKYPVASMSVVAVRRDCFQKLHGLRETVGVMDDYHFYLRLAARWTLRYVDFVGCRKRVSESSLSRLVNLKEMNLAYLEDIRDRHPEVVQKIGSFNFRLRLARKYFKLGRHYAQYNQSGMAKDMYWKAFHANPLNVRYFACYLAAPRSD